MLRQSDGKMTDSREIMEEFTVWVKGLNLQSVAKYNGKLPADFNQLFQAPKLKKLWKYLMEHVKDESTALKVIGNLHLHNLRLENEMISQECSKKADILAQNNLEILHLEEKIRQKKMNCHKSEINKANLQKENISEKMKIILHEAHSKGIPEKRKSLLKHEKYLREIHEDLQKKGQISESEGSEYITCCSDMHEIISMITKQYRTGLNGNPNDNNDLWKLAITAMNKYPAKMIIDALISITKQDKEKVQKQESDIGNEKEIPHESPIAVVQHLIQKHHKACMGELHGAVEHENVAKNTSKMIEHWAHQIHQHISSLPDAQRAKDQFDAEVELKGSEAYLLSFQHSIQALQAELERDSHAQQQINNMQHEMKDFNKELMKNKSEIVQATSQNSQFRESLLQVQADAITFSKQSYCDEQPEFGHLCTMLQTDMKNELAALDDADLLPLLSVDVNLKEVPIYDLSIHRPLNVSYECGSFAYQQIAFLLGLHNIKSPSGLMEEIFHRKDVYQFYQSLEIAALVVKQKSDEKSSYINEMHQQISTSRKQHAEKMMDLMNQGKKWVGLLHDGEEKLEEALHEWYDQPAQHQAPWIRIEGLDLAKWKQSRQTQMS